MISMYRIIEHEGFGGSSALKFFVLRVSCVKGPGNGFAGILECLNQTFSKRDRSMHCGIVQCLGEENSGEAPVGFRRICRGHFLVFSIDNSRVALVLFDFCGTGFFLDRSRLLKMKSLAQILLNKCMEIPEYEDFQLRILWNVRFRMQWTRSCFSTKKNRKAQQDALDSDTALWMIQHLRSRECGENRPGNKAQSGGLRTSGKPASPLEGQQNGSRRG